MTFKERASIEYKIICDKFDARDELYSLLQEQFDRHGQIPAKYLADWNAYQKDNRPWREIKGMKRKLMRIAKQNARNQLNREPEKDEMARAYLDKKLKKLGRERG